MGDDDRIRKGTATRAIAMLEQAIDGATFAAVAQRHGIGRTAAERQVKALAVRLCSEVGIAGLNVHSARFISRLRSCRAEVRHALASFDVHAPPPAHAERLVGDAEIHAAAARLQQRSANPCLDVAFFYMIFVTAARPLEIARLRVRDYLDAQGAVRRESVLPAEASLNGRARPLYFATRRLDDALDAYLQLRVDLRQELGAAAGYRGLDPDSPLFLNSRGERFKLIAHGEAGQQRTLCRPMLETYRRILRQAGLQGVTTRSIRRSVAIRMHERGASEAQIGDMVGISNRSAVRELLRRPRPRLDELMADLV